MQGLAFHGPGDVRFARNLPDPEITTPGDAIVEVTASGLCGSDLHPYQGREPARAGVVAGHEAVGRVAEVGAAVHSVAVGDRVLVPFTTSCGDCPPCRRNLSARCEQGALFGWGDPARPQVPALEGAQASRMRIPLADTTLVPLPADRSDLDGVVLADNLPTGWVAVERLGAVIGQTVAVLGLGSVGLCAVWAAGRQGAAAVVGIDPVAERRDRARRLGAATAPPEDAARTLQELAGADGAVGVVDAAGTDAAQRAAVALPRAGGVVSLIAVPTGSAFAFPPATLYDRNLTVVGGRAPVRSVLQRLLPDLAGVALPTDVVVTHPQVPLEEGPATYATFAAREAGLVKAVFRP